MLAVSATLLYNKRKRKKAGKTMNNIGYDLTVIFAQFFNEIK